MKCQNCEGTGSVDDMLDGPNFPCFIKCKHCNGTGESIEINMKDKIAEAQVLLEGVLDTLVEVGNGITDADLHEAANDLFKFRGIFDQIVLALRLNKFEIKMEAIPKKNQG